MASEHHLSCDNCKEPIDTDGQYTAVYVDTHNGQACARKTIHLCSECATQTAPLISLVSPPAEPPDTIDATFEDEPQAEESPKLKPYEAPTVRDVEPEPPQEESTPNIDR